MLLYCVDTLVQYNTLQQGYTKSASKTARCWAYIKNLKASDIQHPDEELPWLFSVQHLVDTDDHPQEHPLIDGFSQGRHGVTDLKKHRRGIKHTWTTGLGICIPTSLTHVQYHTC